MKFRSERDTLVEALSAAARAVSTRAVGATTGLHLVVKANELTATGTDLDLTVRAVIEVIGIDDGEAVVPARLVADAVRHLEPGAVTIDASEEKVEISAARSRFSLRTFPPADFPSLPASGARSTSVAAGELVEALRQVVRASSSDDARPLLTGVLFTNEDGTLRLVATDSYRLALCDLPGRGAIAGDRDLLVPSRALNELQRICGAWPEDAEVGVALSDTEVTFRQRRRTSARGSSTARTRTTASSSRRATRTGCTSARRRSSRRCAAHGCSSGTTRRRCA